MRTDHPAPAVKRLFVNYFEIGFNQHELLFNLGQFYENDAEPAISTQLATTPAYAKKLLRLLELSVQRYESRFGEIAES